MDPIRTRIDLLCKLYIIYITVSEPRVIGFLVRRVAGGGQTVTTHVIITLIRIN